LKIALDAMGGDHAPDAIVAGAVEAAPLLRSEVLLVGDPNRIGKLLPKPCPSNLQVHPASQVVEMCERPTEALKRKKDSSLVVATELVKEGVAACMVSAGNTGAAVAATLLRWRPMRGFYRPAIASEMPSVAGNFLMLDVGASPDVDPKHLVEFAIMGRAYSHLIMGREKPKVHLLNIGEEEGKGNAFAKEAYHHLSRHEWFAGNIEGKDMFITPCDVVVCDAFVGNITLKTSEGVAEAMMKMVRAQVPRTFPARIAYAPLRKVFAPLQRKMDYAQIGGSPLLGLNDLCIICHGRSNATAIKNALLQAEKILENQLIQRIEASIKELG
jgi:glycerol-3-phosphate acyltransferase PlsX